MVVASMAERYQVECLHVRGTQGYSRGYSRRYSTDTQRAPEGYSRGTQRAPEGYSRGTQRAPEGRHLAPAVKVEPQQVCPPQLEVLAEHELQRPSHPIASHRIAPHHSQPPPPHEARRHVPHKARTPGRGGHARIGPRRAPFGQARAPQACRRVRGAVRCERNGALADGNPSSAAQPRVCVGRVCVRLTDRDGTACLDGLPDTQPRLDVLHPASEDHPPHDLQLLLRLRRTARAE